LGGGYLRRSVRVSSDGETVALAHPIWTLELSKSWVDRIPALWQFLGHRAPANTVPEGIPEVEGVLTLLRVGGCLSWDGDRAAYSLREVHELVRPLFFAWYGQYYGHALWHELRTGTLPRNGLVAWLIHNYHVSRSAGMSDARCATRLTKREWRAAFARNAVDEYAHCDEFYFVHHAGLRIDDEEVKQYVHLPSSLAFDQQMLRLAEDDALAHLLVSLFQESTARFSDQCRDFYRKVEAAYELPGLFHGWEQHLDIDLRDRHAGRLTDLLDTDETCPRESLLRSLLNVWFTVHYLIDALDDIRAEGARGDEIRLRHPIRHGLLNPRETSMVPAHATAAVPIVLPDTLDGLMLESALESLRLEERPTSPPSPADLAFLAGDLGRSIYKAMSHSRSHDDVVLFGRLAEEVYAASKGALDAPEPPDSHHAMAVANFLSEESAVPGDFAWLLHHAARGITGSWVPLGQHGDAAFRRYLSSTRPSAETRDRLVTRALQLDELIERWQTSAAADAIDFFSY